MKDLLVAMVLLAPAAGAFEPRDLRGLSIEIESIPEPVLVEGLAMRIQIARGTDVPTLVQRIERRWQAEGAELQRLQQQGWQMLGRWEEGRSELLQWRGVGEEAQLLLSEFDTLRRQAKPAPPPFNLPAGCHWGIGIEGAETSRGYTQRSALCKLASAHLTSLLRASLSAQGWTLRGEGGPAIEVARGKGAGRVIVLPARPAGQSALVWIGIQGDEGVGN